MKKHRILKVWDSKSLKYRRVELNNLEKEYRNLCYDCEFKLMVNDGNVRGESSFAKDINRKLRPDILVLNRCHCIKKHIYITLPLGCDGWEKNE